MTLQCPMKLVDVKALAQGVTQKIFHIVAKIYNSAPTPTAAPNCSPFQP